MNNRVYIPAFIFLFVYVYSSLFASGNKYEKEKVIDPFKTTSVARIGDYPFPTNPMNDRAIGYLLQGKINNGISNYGNIINWDEQPSGLWGDYSYLPSVAFLAGLPGHKRTSEFQWSPVESVILWFIVFGHPRVPMRPGMITEIQTLWVYCLTLRRTLVAGTLIVYQKSFLLMI